MTTNARPYANSYWVEPGRLLAGEYPGDWPASAMRQKLQLVLAAGVTFFLDLTHPNDPLQPYAPVLQQMSKAYARPAVYQRMAIVDLNVPSVAQMVQTLALIEEALAECGVEVITGDGAAAVDAQGVTTASGLRIESNTVIWTAGARAHPLAAQIAGEHDRLGRVVADAFLHATAAPGIFVTGDVAHAATDDAGNVAAMSCQHALSLGRVAGYNAAAELVGLPLHPYRQPKYVTCLDLGPWGAIFTEGWDRQVQMTREVAKSVKREINTKWIYPPAPDRTAAFAVANPDYVIVP